MSTPFLGEIRMFSFGFPPKGWAFAAGQLLPINQNQALFSLFGTTYGGDGRVNFALPNLRSRTPIHVGSGFTQGQAAGQEAHTLTTSEMPAHNHILQGSLTAGNVPDATNNLLGAPLNLTYRQDSPSTTMSPGTITTVGGSQAHLNLQPFLALNFCVALQGIFPSQT